MTNIYCPLSMISGKPARCLRFYDDNDCYYCPCESLSVGASGLRDSMRDLVSVINEKDFYDSNTGIEGALADVADSLNYPASMFGTSGIAEGVQDIACALQDSTLSAKAEGRE